MIRILFSIYLLNIFEFADAAEAMSVDACTGGGCNLPSGDLSGGCQLDQCCVSEECVAKENFRYQEHLPIAKDKLDLFIAQHTPVARSTDINPLTYGTNDAAPFEDIFATTPDAEKVHKVCGYMYDGLWQGYSKVTNSAAETDCKRPQFTDNDDPAKIVHCVTYTKQNTGEWVASDGADVNTNEENKKSCWWFKVKVDKEWIPLADLHAGYHKQADKTGDKNIHVIWWGNPTAEKHRAAAFRCIGGNADTSKGLDNALKGKGYTIYYWYQKIDNEPVIEPTTQNYPDVTFRSIGAGGDIASVGALLEGTNLAGRAAAIDYIIAALNKDARFYAFVKDLISIVVLYKYGGFFFDTNVDVDAPIDQLATRLENAVAGATWPILPIDNSDGLIPLFYGKMPKIEVNGMYCPKAHARWDSALERILNVFRPAIDKDFKILTQDAYPPAKWDKYTIDQFRDKVTYYWTQESGIFYVGYTLIECAKVDHNPRRLLYWATVKTTQEDNHSALNFRAIGVTKHYANSWRMDQPKGGEKKKKVAATAMPYPIWKSIRGILGISLSLIIVLGYCGARSYFKNQGDTYEVMLLDEEDFGDF